MPPLWDNKVTFVSVCQFWGFSLVLPFLTCLCLWTFCNSRSYCLTWRKKKKGGGRGRNKISLMLTLILFNEFCWSYPVPQEEGGWALLFSLPMVLRGWGPSLGLNIHSCPVFSPDSLWAARLKSATLSLGAQHVSSSGSLFQSTTQPLKCPFFTCRPELQLSCLFGPVFHPGSFRTAYIM